MEWVLRYQWPTGRKGGEESEPSCCPCLLCPSQVDLQLLAIIASLIVTLFLGTLTGFCVWRRKRKAARR